MHPGSRRTWAVLPGGDGEHVALLRRPRRSGRSTSRSSTRRWRVFGRFDHLAHVAAVLRRRAEIVQITEDDWDFQVDINLKGAFSRMRSAATACVPHSPGPWSITGVHVAGLDDRRLGGSVVYAATKGGIVSTTGGDLARNCTVRYADPVNTAQLPDLLVDSAYDARAG